MQHLFRKNLRAPQRQDARVVGENAQNRVTKTPSVPDTKSETDDMMARVAAELAPTLAPSKTTANSHSDLTAALQSELAKKDMVRTVPPIPSEEAKVAPKPPEDTEAGEKVRRILQGVKPFAMPSSQAKTPPPSLEDFGADSVKAEQTPPLQKKAEEEGPTDPKADPPALPGLKVEPLVVEDPVQKKAKSGSRVFKSLRWAVIGFVVGIAFWNLVGFWDFMRSVVLAGPEKKPSAIEMALNDKAADKLAAPKTQGQLLPKDESSIPADPAAALEQAIRTCVSLELDRLNKLTVPKPCRDAERTWPANGQVQTAARTDR